MQSKFVSLWLLRTILDGHVCLTKDSIYFFDSTRVFCPTLSGVTS